MIQYFLLFFKIVLTTNIVLVVYTYQSITNTIYNNTINNHRILYSKLTCNVLILVNALQIVISIYFTLVSPGNIVYNV